MNGDLGAFGGRPGGERTLKCLDHVAEQRLRAHGPAAVALGRMMSGLSEDYRCSEWVQDLAYRLWAAVQGDKSDLGGDLSAPEVDELRGLADEAGGWVAWDKEASGPVFVPMQDWLRLYVAYGARKGG